MATLKIILSGERLVPGLLVLAWGVIVAAVTLYQIFQGNLLPQRFYGGTSSELLPPATIFYIEILAVSIFAGAVMADIGRAIVSFMISYMIAGLTIFSVLSLPALVDTSPLANLTFTSALVFTFLALFPLPLVIGLTGTFLGAGLIERYT